MSGEEMTGCHAWMAYRVAELMALRPPGWKRKGPYSKRSLWAAAHASGWRNGDRKAEARERAKADRADTYAAA